MRSPCNPLPRIINFVRRKASLTGVLFLLIVFIVAQIGYSKALGNNPKFDLYVLQRFSLDSPAGQLRAVPVNIGKDKLRALLMVYCADAEVDPYVEMFFFPKDTLKLKLFTQDGKCLWMHDLGPGVVPGIWFCPVFPFDLDNDGVDEIWFVGNIDPDHPLSLRNSRLVRINAITGETTGQWPWPNPERNQSPSHTFRNFILGGYVRGKPVLVTAQGTYGPMKLQGWNPDMSPRWEYKIEQSTPGARGSHMCPVVDINNDGIDEIFWGERCIELDTGRELFCADRDSYRGHSDVIQPIFDCPVSPGRDALRQDKNRWFIFTCRESSVVSPRVVMFNDSGQRIWGDLEKGHMDMGWAARIGQNAEHIVMAIRIGAKSAGPKGFFRKETEEFTYRFSTGEKVQLPYSVFCTLPVDLNGDGIHELVRGLAEGDGKIIDNKGRVIGSIDGSVAIASKFMGHPGEQILSYNHDGIVSIWADRNAKDNSRALKRYKHPFYRANQRLTATGYNIVNLGGL